MLKQIRAGISHTGGVRSSHRMAADEVRFRTGDEGFHVFPILRLGIARQDGTGTAGEEDGAVGGGLFLDVHGAFGLGIDRPGGGDREAGLHQALGQRVPGTGGLVREHQRHHAVRLRRKHARPADLLDQQPTRRECLVPQHLGRKPLLRPAGEQVYPEDLPILYNGLPCGRVFVTSNEEFWVTYSQDDANGTYKKYQSIQSGNPLTLTAGNTPELKFAHDVVYNRNSDPTSFAAYRAKLPSHACTSWAVSAPSQSRSHASQSAMKSPS